MGKQRKLRKLADVTEKLWKETNYERRQQFFQQKKVNLKGTWYKYYEKYKKVLGVNAQAVLQKNNEAWSSFFSSLKRKPSFMNHVSPLIDNALRKPLSFLFTSRSISLKGE
ncbi:MAG: hypothetical protein MPF33_00195 [Candidatus Aramenus sp.]|nr:hypothetical protein [Candidatus Aramenus sp.]